MAKAAKSVLDELKRYNPKARIRMSYWSFLHSSITKHLTKDEDVFCHDDPIKHQYRSLRKQLKELNKDLDSYNDT